MSIAGKQGIHFSKKDLQDQRVPAIAFKNVKFAHEASAGDTTIDILNLNTPNSGMPPSFTQPNASDLSQLNLQLLRNNLRLVSSLNNYLEFDSYSITSPTTITLGYTAAEGETFVGIIESTPRTGLQVIDNDPVVVTGVLAAGATEILVGKPFDLNKYPSTQMGAVLVYLDGQLLRRNVSNTQSSSGDGDYYEVTSTGTTTNTLEINDSSTSDRTYIVVSNGLAGAAPSDSFLAQLQNLAGQIDQMIPTLAALAGVPTSTFQVAPSDIDLLNFGSRVTQAEADIVNLQATQRKMQVKTSAGASGSATTTLITFNSLQIGKIYTIVFSGNIVRGTANTISLLAVSHDSSELRRIGLDDNGTYSPPIEIVDFVGEISFEATANTAIVQYLGNNGNNSVSNVEAKIIEENDLVLSTDFT